MTGLGLSPASLTSGQAGTGTKGAWAKGFRIALGSGGGAAIVFALFDLIRNRPGESFQLLNSWGPWPVIALVAMVLVGMFLSRINETISTAFSAIVSSSQEQAQSMGKLADAVSRVADQGNKQAQEVQRLALYAAQEFPGVYERLDSQDKVLGEIAETVRHLAARGKHGDGN